MRKETGMPLSVFFLKYFLYVSAAVTFICLGAVFILNVLVAKDLIYPANYAQKQAEAARERIERAPSVSRDLIPGLCQYAVFDLEGNVTDGNIGKTRLKTAWEAVSGKRASRGENYYKVVRREREYVVLQYQIIPQYKSETLRRYLWPPQNLLMLAVLFMAVFSVGVIALRFSRALKKKLDSLIVVTEKIQGQDLDFSVEKGDIREINSILTAMDKMRHELKTSLETQWKAEQERKEQIGALAHDLKTPLTVIRGNAEILYDTDLTEEQAGSVGFIEESSLKMQNYIKMLIELSKDTETCRPRHQKNSLPAFLQDIGETARGICSSRKIRFKLKVRSEREEFFGDASLLSRALNNILSNAAEYSPSGGAVAMEVFEENEYLAFSVSDNGKGFSSAALKHAASQFYMEDASRSSKLHYGIGLYAADRIARQHGGLLVLENQKEGRGAKVTLKIPLCSTAHSKKNAEQVFSNASI